ncbi:MAG: hypothetical protein LBE48_02930 [Methanomassiliicoccaceae archaeon]|nr:hypothetical protein [Methanomassiliicoccaceae archaeon]
MSADPVIPSARN